MRSLGQRAARGGAVTMVGQLAKALLQIASVVILARLLSVEDFGLVGMVTALIGFGHILRDAGLASATIQSKELSRGEMSNLLWINTGIGAVVAIAVAALAGPVAAFYDRPVLMSITLALAPTFFLSGAASQLQAVLIRELRFGTSAAIEITSNGLALMVAVVLGWAGAGPWALIAQHLVGGVLTLALLSAVVRWRPCWYDRSINMSRFYSFGLPVLGSQILTYVANNADTVILGKFFGATWVGHYSRALQLVRTPLNQVRSPLGNLSLSILSRIQDHDHQLMSYIHKGQAVVCYPLVLASAVVVVAAEPLVYLALGDGWAKVVVFVQLIAIGEAVNTLPYVGSWIYMSRGLTAALLRFTLVSSGVRIVFLALGAIQGPVGVGIGFTAAQVVLWPLSILYVGRVSGLSTGPLLVSSVRIIAVAVFSGIVGHTAMMLGPQGNLYVTVLLAMVGVGLAATAVAVLPSVRRDYIEVLSVLHRVIR